MKRAIAITVTCALLGSAAALPAAQARSHHQPPSARSQQSGPRLISASEAAREARTRYGGRVLSVRLHGSGKHAYYQVKLLRNGNVRVVRIAASR